MPYTMGVPMGQKLKRALEVEARRRGIVMARKGTPNLAATTRAILSEALNLDDGKKLENDKEPQND